jgi:hypothetical protein
MSIEITARLRGLGLEQYIAAFRNNDIDAAVLPRLTSEDLRELGVVSVGHRRRLLDAIATLGTAAADSPTETAASPGPRGDAERRHLTVMFCDLVDSTALAAQLDPEDLREVIAAYHRAAADVVESFSGFVAKYMGDGILAYFGYPRSHEDDAERADWPHCARRCRSPRCWIRQTASSHWDCHGIGHRRRSDRRGLGAGASNRSTAKRRISPPVCKPWPRQMPSSSRQPRGG